MRKMDENRDTKGEYWLMVGGGEDIVSGLRHRLLYMCGRKDIDLSIQLAICFPVSLEYIY
jgi:hypothetical protein